MNAERLLALYERMAEAPDAITRLRRFILDLAVRGKLVPQDAQDGLVEKRYQKEPSGKGIPATWRLLNFGKFCDIEGGSQPPKSQFIEEPREGYVRLFQIRDLGERPVPTYIPRALARSFCKEGEILIGRYGASIGKIFWAQEGAYNVAMAKFIWPTDTFILAFAFLLLKSDFLQGPLLSATRSAQAGFNKSDLAPINFPLPPLAEQHRIVAKVDELMALCDSLEAARKDREAKRDRLSAASLTRLNTPDPETFTADARFTLEALPALTTRPNQIKQLRQTILNLAVRGKLVLQDPNDEPASILHSALSRTFATPARTGGRGLRTAIAKGLIDEPPFSPASGWLWVRMGELGETNIGLTYSPNDLSNNGIPVLRSNNVRDGRIVLDELVRVVQMPKPSVMVNEGDMLICARNGSRALVGKAAIIPHLPEPMAFGAFMAIFRSPINPYLHLFLTSPIFREVIDEVNTNTINQITQANLRSTLVPLPPLAEQHRIVAKVDELMALCDRLEASLTTSDQTRTRLLEATLTEALSQTANDRPENR